MVISQLFGECLELLSGEDSRFDLSCIFEDVLHRRFPLIPQNEEVSPEDEKTIRTLVKRRSAGEPLQYILGEWEFYGLPMKVGEGVLIPRPDTETLIEDVLRLVKENSLNAPKIADLCSGSGCIAIALKHLIPAAEVYAAELSDDALYYLRQNAELNSADINIIQGDVLSPETAENFRDFDIIVSNPPYLTAKDMSELQTEVQKEPRLALYGGDDGLDFYRKMTPLWKNSLKDGGFLLYEFGMGQENDIAEILTQNGFDVLGFSRDGGGIIRTAASRRDGEPPLAVSR